MSNNDHIIRTTARAVSLLLLAVFGCKLCIEAFENGLLIETLLIVPFMVGIIFCFVWDRFTVIRIPGILSIILCVSFLVFMMAAGRVRGVEPNEVVPLFSIIVMLLGLLFALKWEGLGGALAIAGWIAFVAGYAFRDLRDIVGVSLILSPIMVIGFVHVVCWRRAGRQQNGHFR